MKQITITIPDEMEAYFWEHDPMDVFERNALILYPYIKMKRISLRKAAEMLNTTYEILGGYYGECGLFLEN